MKSQLQLNRLIAVATFIVCCCAAWGNLLGPLGRNYGESCSETEPCNSIKYLECNHGRCDCIFPHEIVYESRTEGCAALAGFSCLRQIPNNPKSVSNNNKPPVAVVEEVVKVVDTTTTTTTQAPKYQIACVPHAKCSYPEDICECEFRYFKAPNNTCLPQRGYSERCSSDEQCDKYRFLNCIGGICTCDKNHKFDLKNKKCMVVVGAECKIIDYMSISEERFQEDECPEDASCRPSYPDSDKGVCQCENGFKLSSDRTCGRDYGDECGINRKCSDVQFICRNGSCQCKYPMHQFYDPETRRCVSLAGGPCDSPNSLEQPITTCTEHGVCQESTPFNFCKCQLGFIETNEGKCVKAFGSSCEWDDECDPIPTLACVENQCNCPDKLMVYDDKQRSCVSLAGGRCRKEANTTVPVCTSNAYCVKTSGQLEYGRCVCARGTTTTTSRLCSKGQ